MINQEIVELNGKKYTVSKSDDDKLLLKIGTSEIYREAWDIFPLVPYYEEITEEEANKIIESTACEE